MNKPVYIYDAEVEKIVDGDTVDLLVSLGFRVQMKLRFRLARINAAEMSDPRVEIKDKALKGKERLALLLKNPSVTIQSSKPLNEDKYGRWLAEIYTKTGVNVNQVMLDEGLAKIYPDKF